jgi:glycosyltransferase involved in cell wall biosynthesis
LDITTWPQAMPKTPKVSLVIPAYNEELYIADCLTCVKKSGGKFYEIIVIDNASSDRTAAIVQSFPDVRVVREAHKGVAYARQRGFQETSGDIVAYMDADCRMAPGWYERIIEEFRRNDDLACLSGPYEYYDIPLWQTPLVKLIYVAARFLSAVMIGYMAIGGNFAIRRDVLQNMGGFDTSIAFYGDDTNIARMAHRFGRVSFARDFVMQTSGRRFVQQGFVKVGFLYVINCLSVIMTQRPITQRYTDLH